MKILDWITRWLLKPISPPLCVILVIVSIPYAAGCSPNSQAKPPLVDPKTLAAQARKVTGAEKLTNSLEDLEALCTAITRQLSRKKTVTGELPEAKGIAQDLVRADSQIRAEFAKTRGVLAKIGSREKNRIQAKVERDYASKMRKTQAMVATLTRQKTTAGLITRAKQLAQFIDAVTPEPPHQPLGTELPHRIVDYHAGPPTLGTQIAPAYAPSTPNAQASNLPRTPTAADTSETIEVQFTEDISKTANDLNKDPVKMYEFVRNTIVHEPYYGSRKGAAETLLEKGGNDFDQASLLIALYRFSGIPARYVQGVVEIPITKAMNWVGVEKPEVAAKMFSAGGVPSQAIISGGRISAIRLEHVWTEVYVDYENYRGAEAGPGKKQWIPLDPSFKQYERIKPDDISQFVSTADRELISETTSESLQATASAITSMDTTAIGQMLGEVSTRTADAAASSYTTETAYKISGRERILPVRLGLLPPTLATKPVATGAEWQAVPTAVRTSVRFKVADVLTGSTVLEYQAPIATLGEKRLTLSYEAHSTDDETAMRQYDSIEDVPSYLANVHSVLLLEGERLATGSNPTPIGARQVLSTTIEGPEARSLGDTPLFAGCAYAVVFDLGRVATQTLSDSADAFKGEMDRFEGQDPETTVTVNRDKLVGGMLHGAGLWYFAVLDAIDHVSAHQQNLAYTRDISLAVTGTEGEQVAMFGVPVRLKVPGLFFDVDSDAVWATPKDGDTSRLRSYNMQAGVTSSLLEGMAWQTLLGSPGTGISTVSVICQALETGIPVYQIDTTSVDSVLPQLALPADIKVQMRDYAAQGNIVMTPERSVTIGTWTGSGYIVMDPDTGNAQYLISGGLSGGFSMWERLAAALAVMLAHLSTKTPALWVGPAAAVAAAVAVYAGFVEGIKMIESARIRPAMATYWKEWLNSYTKRVIGGLAMLAVAGCVRPAEATLASLIAGVIYLLVIKQYLPMWLEDEERFSPYGAW